MRWCPALGVVLAAAAALAPGAAADDPPPRERFLRDGDARTLAASLASSADPRDREDRDLALLAVDPAATPSEGATPLVRAAHALRAGTLAQARAALAVGLVPGGPSGALVAAVVKARGGEDEPAARVLLGAPAADGPRDEATLALIGRTLSSEDRRLVGGALRLAIVQAASASDLAGVERLAALARAFDPEGFPRCAVLAARALRRGGAPERAEALLASRAPAASDPADLRLERAIAAWRADGPRAASEAAARGDAARPAWAFSALARADAPASVPSPPAPLHVHEDDLHAAALARVAALAGAPARTEEVLARASARKTTAADPTFCCDWLARLGLATAELAGDAPAVELALSLGLPVVLYRVGRRGDAFREHPFVVRARDAATGLLLGEPLDLGAVDVLPADAPAKARVLVVAPASKAAALADLRARPSAAVGAALGEAVSAPAEAAPARLAGRSAALAPSPVFDLYLAFLAYPAATMRREGAALAEVRAAVARSSATAPVTPFEHYVQALAAPDVDRAVASLDAALEAAGEVSWLRTARFVTLAGARRTGEALADVERALDLDPLDTRTLYFRASTRRLLGDRASARVDLERVIDRRPTYVAAVEDLVRMHVDDGRAAEAIAALGAFESADREAAGTERVRSLRRGAELAMVRRAGSAADLRALAASPEPETRRKVAVALPGFEGDESEAALRVLLADPDEGVRVTAVRGYLRPWLRARAAKDEALLGVLVRLLDDPAETVRSAAATALGSLDAPAACSAVAARLTGPSRDASPSVRASAADALSGRDVPPSRAALEAALSDDDLEVRRAALASLHRIAATTFDYVPEDPPEKRAAAVARWEAWARQPR